MHTNWHITNLFSFLSTIGEKKNTQKNDNNSDIAPLVTAVIECLLSTKCRFQYFYALNCSSYLLPLYSSENLNNLPQITQVVHAGPRIWTQSSYFTMQFCLCKARVRHSGIWHKTCDFLLQHFATYLIGSLLPWLQICLFTGLSYLISSSNIKTLCSFSKRIIMISFYN